ILAACAEQLKPAILELGGKSASLLFPDTDIDAACARAIQWTIGILAGQGCALATRLLVHESIYDEVVQKLVAIAKQYKVGNPFDEGVAVGPLINADSVDLLMVNFYSVRYLNTGRYYMDGKCSGGVLAVTHTID